MPSERSRVVVYTTQYCPYCEAAKKLLKSKGVPFKEIDVTGSPEMRERLVEMSGGRTTVPEIFVDGKCVGGYDELVAFYRSGKTI